jgi:CubicO group peptidase (beta-lactamase class C family)
MVATVHHSSLPASPEEMDSRLGEIERQFQAQLSPLRLFPGAALAVYHHGRLVLDLAAGLADTQRGEPVRPETLFLLFSCSKPLASLALWQQIERGAARLDDAVAAHWPAFAQHGKGRVTLRHILSHRGGFPLTPPALTPQRWGDWDAVVNAIAAMPLSHAPGAVSAYHHLTQQWVCAELVRRLDGRTYRDYLRAEITGPLRMHDTFVGLPPEQMERAALLHATEHLDERDQDIVRTFNLSAVRRAVVPAATGFSTARDMARLYAALAAGGELDGASILRPETVERILAVEVDGEIDQTFDVPVRRGLGFELGGTDDPRRQWAGATSTVRTFWHGGFGSSICWGDADSGLAMAFLSNGVRRDEAGAIARRDLSDAVRAAFRNSARPVIPE